MKIKLRVFLVTLLVVLNAAGQENLLKNSSFEEGLNDKGIPKHWGEAPYNQTLDVDQEATPLNSCIKIHRGDMGYSIGAQIIELNLTENSTLTLIGSIKGKDIAAESESWKGAKAQVVFLDKNDNPIGNPSDTQIFSGTFEWKMFIQDIPVPAQAKKAKVLLGLWGAKGSVWFDEVQLYEVNKKAANNDNILTNGDFELWGSWEFLGQGKCEIKFPGYTEKGQALYVSNTTTSWTFAMQKIAAANLKNKRVNLSGMVKTKHIGSGVEKWQKGRIYAEYKDKEGKRIGDWNELITAEGTTEWTSFSKDFFVPEKAETVELYFGLQDATGEIAFDNLVLK